MSMKNWEKIDKFYIVLTLALVVLSALFVMSVKTVFSTFITYYEVERDTESETRIDKGSLEEAYNFIFQK